MDMEKKQINGSPEQREGEHCISIIININDFPQNFMEEFYEIGLFINTKIVNERWFEDGHVTFSQFLPTQQSLSFCCILPSLESRAAIFIKKILNSFIYTSNTTYKLKIFNVRVDKEKVPFVIDLFYGHAFFDTFQMQFREGLLHEEELVSNPSIRKLEERINLALSRTADQILHPPTRIQRGNEKVFAFFNYFLNIQEKVDVERFLYFCKTFLKEK
jgi:hypothetical protein